MITPPPTSNSARHGGSPSSSDIDHAIRLADQIERADELELLVRPDLDVVAFRHRGGDETNRAISAALQQAGDIHLRGAVVNGSEALRVCFMHYGTTNDDVDRIVPAVRLAATQRTIR